MTEAPLAMAASPLAWLVLGFLLLAVLAPRTLPLIGRLLGELVSLEIRRRLGLPPPPRRPRRSVVKTAGVEVLPPEQPAPTLRAGTSDSLTPAAAPARPAGLPMWSVGLIVLSAVAILLWFLLHAR